MSFNTCWSIFPFVLAIGIFIINQCQSTTYYLNQAQGNDSNHGTDVNNAFQTADTAVDVLSPGDMLIIVGELSNPSYDSNYSFNGDLNDSQIWHQENTFKLNNLNGTSNAWITITSYDSNTVLRGDGANILRIDNCAYIRLQNLTLIGEVLTIPYSTAKALQFVYKDENDNIQYRVDPNLSDDDIANLTLPNIGTNVIRPSYTDTRGIYVSDSHHILIKGNLVSNTPGNGLRVAKSEYVDIIENEVVNTSRKSYSGTHGLVVTYTKDQMPQENKENYRCRILRNIVHHNYNEIYSWVGWKTFIHPYIDEGKGISLERNQNFNNSGRILMANNIAYYNGYAGINNHDGDNVDIIANTAYMNSYTNSITYANKSDRNGNNVGISINGGHNCTIINNIAVIDASDPSWIGKALSVAGITGTLKVSSNIIYGIGSQTIQYDEDLYGIQENTIESDPKFVQYLSDADSMINNGDAFMLNIDSPAISAGNYGYEPCEDVFTKERTNNTIGAVGIGSSDVDTSNTTYLDECYSWIHNVTIDTGKSNSGKDISVIRLSAIADGFIQYRENIFQGTKNYLDVKSPSASTDFRMTHIRFNSLTETLIEDMINCSVTNILNVSLLIKSTGLDSDINNSLILYLAFDNWKEWQNTTHNISSLNDSETIITSVPIDLKQNIWVSIPLNRTLFNKFNYPLMETFDIIITSTVGARVLQFYSRESGVNNTAQIELYVKCAQNSTTSYSTTTEATTTESFFNATDIETTQSAPANRTLRYDFEVFTVKDGFIRYRENDFNGQLSYLDIKHRTGSDLRETHLGFNMNLLDLANTVNESITDSNYKCQITKTRLKIKSMGWDKDLTHKLLIYLVNGNWSESQTDTIGIPSINESIGILASIPIYLIKNKWVTITLNQSLLCNKLFECNDIYNNNSLIYEGYKYNWNMIVSATQDARILQFYSKESGIGNAPHINLQIECNNTELLTPQPTSQPSIRPTIDDDSGSNRMLTSISYRNLFIIIFYIYVFLW